MLNHYLFRVKTVYFAAMNFFSFIMAVLVLVLSVFPCADRANERNDNYTQFSISAQHNQQENHDQNDICTPFCSCTCCTCTSINHFIVSATSLMIFDCLNYSTFLPARLFDFSPPVWQPPQLV